MRTTRQLSITLPNAMADALRQRVNSGAYASESEVVRDGLRTLFARDQVLESWLREEVVSAYDELVADPSSGVSVEDVRARLSAKHAAQR
jgi:antitoxin ParD1/3/4